MIARMWRGWTTRENADAYEALLRTRVLPGIHRVSGYRGASLLRRDVEEGVEFATITHFDSLDSLRAFAGDDLTLAVIPPPKRAPSSRVGTSALRTTKWSRARSSEDPSNP